MPELAYATAIYFSGDPTPLVVNLSPEQVTARLLDAEAQAEECGLPTSRGWARFAGSHGPCLVRPCAVATIIAIAPPQLDEDDTDQ
jgi:hypothetical protein